MNTEFHYWITGIIAKEAGFTDDEARTIATASEYVDENDRIFEIEGAGETKYTNYISQTMNIFKPKTDLMRIYPIFHFVPGYPDAPNSRRKDGKMHLLNTTPNSENANEMMDAAFKADEKHRLYRIGIASHAYADTWAHQNFIGWYDVFNFMGLKPLPAIGHASAAHSPDWVAYNWTDDRLVKSEISNSDRFIDAGYHLFQKYCEYLSGQKRTDNQSKAPELIKKLVRLMGREYSGSIEYYKEDRMKAYKTEAGFLNKFGKYDLKKQEFDESIWFEEAIHTDVRGLKDTGHKPELFKDKYRWKDENFADTDWFKFQESVKEHQDFAMTLLEPTFSKMGIDLHKF